MLPMYSKRFLRIDVYAAWPAVEAILFAAGGYSGRYLPISDDKRAVTDIYEPARVIVNAKLSYDFIDFSYHI